MPSKSCWTTLLATAVRNFNSQARLASRLPLSQGNGCSSPKRRIFTAMIPSTHPISIDEPIGYARRFGLKVAALIHDLLPLTHQNGRAGRRMFVDMAADGGRSDGSELERLRCHRLRARVGVVRHCAARLADHRRPSNQVADCARAPRRASSAHYASAFAGGGCRGAARNSPRHVGA